MNTKIISLVFTLLAIPFVNASQNIDTSSVSRSNLFAQLKAVYQTELGPVFECESNTPRNIALCSQKLKNEGNAPYILLPVGPAQSVVVLFHGLSDSPFFVRSIAEFLQAKGHIVIAPLTPGHGKKDAKLDMRDEALGQRWLNHTDQVMAVAKTLDLPIFVGGFSTGGAFAAHYTLQNPEDITGLMFFSGALQLADSAETMAKIWGIKTIALWLDGEYESMGPNPYKYPSVASYSALVLMDIIKKIRDLLAETSLSKPVFAAHSMADTVTLFEGIENFTQQVQGAHVVFKIDEEFEVCHADVPINSVQIIATKFKKSMVNENELCAVPKANPLHDQMLLMLDQYLQANLNKSTKGIVEGS